jgi:hypothetical protein
MAAREIIAYTIFDTTTDDAPTSVQFAKMRNCYGLNIENPESPPVAPFGIPGSKVSKLQTGVYGIVVPEDLDPKEISIELNNRGIHDDEFQFVDAYVNIFRTVDIEGAVVGFTTFSIYLKPNGGETLIDYGQVELTIYRLPLAAS